MKQQQPKRASLRRSGYKNLLNQNEKYPLQNIQNYRFKLIIDILNVKQEFQANNRRNGEKNRLQTNKRTTTKKKINACKTINKMR